ncbi:hypothetical protein EVAR_20047_1 [Eumeta japonica]|uniref:Uncharacterized protein n=1 Tax=Eumeta variegata TaxID=151549 RepID=A0A4C1UHS2_EUMVA|nr:hypothetical protein EVAR_20047_1 [Eumeta japonica]
MHDFIFVRLSRRQPRRHVAARRPWVIAEERGCHALLASGPALELQSHRVGVTVSHRSRLRFRRTMLGVVCRVEHDIQTRPLLQAIKKREQQEEQKSDEEDTDEADAPDAYLCTLRHRVGLDPSAAQCRARSNRTLLPSV